MVDDALKVTRNLQRLLLVTCAVAVVFLASLRDVSQEQALLADVTKLPELVDEQAYEMWIRNRGADLYSKQSKEVGSLFYDLHERLIGMIPEQTWSLKDALEAPAYASRAPIPQVDLTSTSLRNLDRLSRDLARTDSTVVFLTPSRRLAEQLHAAIDEVNAKEVGTGLTAWVHRAQLRLVNPRAAELRAQDRREPVPLRLEIEFDMWEDDPPTKKTLMIEGWKATVSSSSPFDWWQDEGGPGIFQLSRTAQSLRPPLDPSDTVADVRDELERRVAEAQAGSRTIDFVGISVPGSLALFGIPVLLVGFAASLLIHVRHLHRLAPEHRPTFLQFSWTPLSPGGLWRWETTGLLLLLPVAVHLLMIYRAPAFGGAPSLPTISGLCGAVGSALAGVALLRSIRRLRRSLDLR